MTYGSSAKYVDKYQSINITTETSPEKFILLLYDGILKFSSLAKVAIEDKDIKQKGYYITKVLDILNELKASLDFEKGGEPAKSLDRLYSICIQRLFDATTNFDTNAIDWIINAIKEIRDAWEQAFFPKNPDINHEDSQLEKRQEQSNLDITG